MNKVNKQGFELEVCSRCQGGGTYSYCQEYGDKCFKCQGTGHVLTKRGAAAKAYYKSLCTIHADSIKIGDLIEATGIGRGGRAFIYLAKVSDIRSRKAILTVTKTMRQDGIMNVSHKIEYSYSDEFSVLSSSGSTIERPNDAGYATGEGVFVEEYTEYSFETHSDKYGIASQTASKMVLTYPIDNAALIAKALEYQANLTKMGKERKLSKK